MSLRFFFGMLALFFTSTIFGQNCTCDSVFFKVIEGIENNYSGYFDIIKEKQLNYIQEKEKIRNEISYIKAFDFDCFLKIKKYLSFFSDPHISLSFNTQKQPKQVANFFSNGFPVINPGSFSKQKRNSLVGTWMDDSRRYIIKIENESAKKLIGYIIKGDSLFWFNNQVKIVIEKKQRRWKALYYLRDHSIVHEFLDIQKNFFKVGRYARFTRIANENIITSANFRFKKLSSNFSYLELPNFLLQNKGAIDSLIETNLENINACANLIIDLRNNGGGSSLCYQKLMPFLGVNKFNKFGFSIRSSAEIVKQYQQYVADSAFPKSTREGFANILAKISNQNDTLISIIDNYFVYPDTVYNSLHKIYILINEKTASTSEQFLDYAMQSSKVIVLGNSSYGAINYNDINSSFFINCNFLKLNYPMSRSNRIDDLKKQHNAIEPNIKLSIPDNKWIDFVLQKFGKEK